MSSAGSEGQPEGLKSVGIILSSLKEMSRAPFTLSFLFFLAVLSPSCYIAQLGNYKVVKIGDDLVVLPPPYWNRPNNKQITIRFPSPPSKASSGNMDCTIDNPLLHLEGKSGSSPEWEAKLPSLDDWKESVEDGSLNGNFDRLRRQIATLEGNGCLSSSEFERLDDAIRQSLPMRMADTIYYRYGYRLGAGSIELEPDMRLEIQRAVFAPTGKFQDTSIVHYRITRDGHHNIRFRFEDATPRQEPDSGLPDRSLARMESGFRFMRLYFLGKHVPPNMNYSAMVIGTQSLGEMEEIAQAVRARPESGCSAASGTDSKCIAFRGSVSVSAQIEVWLNRARTHYETSWSLGSLLSDELPRCRSHPQSLRVTRLFLNKPTPVIFDSGNRTALDLTLVGGDHISCPAQ